MFVKTKINLQRKKVFIIFLEIITRDPSIYTMDHADLTVSNFMGYSIGTKRAMYPKSNIY